jgi:hypothetical protein
VARRGNSAAAEWAAVGDGRAEGLTAQVREAVRTFGREAAPRSLRARLAVGAGQ